MVDAETHAFLNGYCIEYRCKNFSEAFRKMVVSIKQMRTVISNLEAAAWKQKNIDEPAGKQAEGKSYYDELHPEKEKAVSKFKKDCEEQKTLDVKE